MRLASKLYLIFPCLFLVLGIGAAVDLISGHVVWYTIIDAMFIPIAIWLIVQVIRKRHDAVEVTQQERFIAAAAGAVWVGLWSSLLLRLIGSEVLVWVVIALDVLILISCLPWINTGDFDPRRDARDG